MVTATVEEVQAHLAELIAKLPPGEELVITEHGRRVARLVTESAATRKARRLGSAVGILTVHKEDDEHLKDFREYLS